MESEKQSFEPFRLFSTSGSGFLEQSEPPLPPPPPSVEVLPTEISSSVNYTVEPVELGGLTFLKLGCGHGLPGIFACLEGADAIRFQDFNGEVLRCLTIPNVNSNIPSFQPPSLQVTKSNVGSEILFFFAGDWREMHKLLPYALNIEKDPNVIPEQSLNAQYDTILMAETVYSISTLPHLYELIKKCLTPSHGVVYMAAKKHYFGVGGELEGSYLWSRKMGSWLLAWLSKLLMVLLMSERYGSFRLSRLGIHVDQTLSFNLSHIKNRPPY